MAVAAFIKKSFALGLLEKIGLKAFMMILQHNILIIVKRIVDSFLGSLGIVSYELLRSNGQYFFAALNLTFQVESTSFRHFDSFG